MLLWVLFVVMVGVVSCQGVSCDFLKLSWKLVFGCHGNYNLFLDNIAPRKAQSPPWGGTRGSEILGV